MANEVPTTWWSGNYGKAIRDAYTALVPNIALLVWGYFMTAPIPKGSEKWAAVISLIIVILRSCDRGVRGYFEKQKAKVI